MTRWFVLFSLFFPRLTLSICYLIGAMPLNDTPFVLDVVGFVIAPRLLVAAWLWSDPAWGGGWAALLVCASLLAGGGQGRVVHRRWSGPDRRGGNG